MSVTAVGITSYKFLLLFVGVVLQEEAILVRDRNPRESQAEQPKAQLEEIPSPTRKLVARVASRRVRRRRRHCSGLLVVKAAMSNAKRVLLVIIKEPRAVRNRDTTYAPVGHPNGRRRDSRALPITARWVLSQM